MNSGPLPPQGGLPAPLHDVADSRINYGNTLLGNLDPYAYGEPGYLSSQQGYQNHPHRMQKFIPPIHLPEARVGATDTFCVSHPVDDSDVAFCVKLDRRSIFGPGGGPHAQARSNKSMVGTSVDPFINLPTLNYILAGLQLFLAPGAAVQNKWKELLIGLDHERFKDVKDPLYFRDILHIVKNRVFPYGIVRGSEKQGGQNETGYSPATWPVGFIAAMVIDGKDRNINNYWHHEKVDAGDDLLFRLAPVKLEHCHQYTLNHYYKSIQRQNVLGDSIGAHASGITKDKYIWQLVPDKFTLELDTHYGRGHTDVNTLEFVSNEAGMWSEGTPRIKEYVWQHAGYWHIARSQVMVGKYGDNDYYHNDLSHAMYVNHLEVTFSPTWCELKQRSTKTPGAFLSTETHKGVTLAGRASLPSAPTAQLSAPALDTSSLLAKGSALLDAAFSKLDARKRARESNSVEGAPEDPRRTLGGAAPTISSEPQAMDTEGAASRPVPRQPSQQQRPVKKSTTASGLSLE